MIDGHSGQREQARQSFEWENRRMGGGVLGGAEDQQIGVARAEVGRASNARWRSWDLLLRVLGSHGGCVSRPGF